MRPRIRALLLLVLALRRARPPIIRPRARSQPQPSPCHQGTSQLCCALRFCPLTRAVSRITREQGPRALRSPALASSCLPLLNPLPPHAPSCCLLASARPTCSLLPFTPRPHPPRHQPPVQPALIPAHALQGAAPLPSSCTTCGTAAALAATWQEPPALGACLQGMSLGKRWHSCTQQQQQSHHPSN